ncbi:B-cell CLL/lymphoma 7 protein family member C isoform X4 [Tenrec ecaudatus]|uniref:B-cell CLL/lymphoma 7 protein family member C isoform X4 n=1 Tax=Tenrec ecaudatus TaxID=94439 RepID=UPI003F59CFC7
MGHRGAEGEPIRRPGPLETAVALGVGGNPQGPGIAGNKGGQRASGSGEVKAAGRGGRAGSGHRAARSGVLERPREDFRRGAEPASRTGSSAAQPGGGGGGGLRRAGPLRRPSCHLGRVPQPLPAPRRQTGLAGLGGAQPRSPLRARLSASRAPQGRQRLKTPGPRPQPLREEGLWNGKGPWSADHKESLP